MWPFTRRPDKDTTPGWQMPADWDNLFSDRGHWTSLMAGVRELHLRMLVLEGNRAEEQRLRAKLAAIVARRAG